MRVDLDVRFTGSPLEADVIEDLLSSLRNDLEEIDLDSIEMKRSQAAPQGSRGLDVVAAGELVAALGGAGQAINLAALTVLSWFRRTSSPASPVEVEFRAGNKSFRLSDASPDQQEALLREFIRSLNRP